MASKIDIKTPPVLREDIFCKFKGPSGMPIADFAVEFEHLYNKAKVYKMELPDGILASEFLNKANISDSHEKLICATITRVVILTHERTIAQSSLGSEFTCIYECLKTYQWWVIFTGCHLT